MVLNGDIEVVPSDDILEKVKVLAPGTRISVTSSPDQGIDATINLSCELKRRGFTVIPHLAARSIVNFKHLASISCVLENQKIDEVFMIAGDNKEPAGSYLGSPRLLEDFLRMNRAIKTVGVAGYPEGHIFLNDETVIRSLKIKHELTNEYKINLKIHTQTCFEPEPVINWVKRIRGMGIDSQISLGIWTKRKISSMLNIAKATGVGASIRYLEMTGIDSNLKQMLYDATGLLKALAAEPEADNISAFHIFTLNSLEKAVDWQKNFKLTA